MLRPIRLAYVVFSDFRCDAMAMFHVYELVDGFFYREFKCTLGYDGK